jgi:hypothetical protein
VLNDQSLRERGEVSEESGKMRLVDLRKPTDPAEAVARPDIDISTESRRFVRLDGSEGSIDPFAAHDTINETSPAT